MKRLLTLLLVAAMGFAPLAAQKKEAYKVRTVVIDPGHGGAKPGAHGSRAQEKDITLAVALKFGRLVADNYPDVKIIYTRTTDVDISLAERARIANQGKADLFISIHANSHPTSAPSGVETFVMGLSESSANLEVAKKENADILLEADYKNNEAYKDFDPNSPESYVLLTMFQNEYINKSLNFAQAIQKQYRQNLRTINRGVKQAELFVLYKTAMPSVLTEIGFISNPTEEAFMLSDEGQAKIAISLFNAFMAFKAAEEGTGRIANPVINIKGYVPPEVAEAQPKPAVAEATAPVVEEKPVPVAVVEEAPAPVAEEKPAPVAVVEEAPAPVVEEKPAPVAEEKPAPVAVAEVAPVPVVEEKPAVAEAKPEPEVKPEPEAKADTVRRSQPPAKPVPSTTLAEREPARQEPAATPAPAKQPKHRPTLQKPTNTATGTPFYTVQFLTSTRPLAAGAPELENISSFEYYQRGSTYCYYTGRFTTFAQASAYCEHIKQATSFADAWVVQRKEATAATPVPSATPAAQATANADGVVYRVQFCTTTRQMQPGDPDLHGISDIRSARSGKHVVYTAGNYTTRAEADRRCAEIRRTTPFKDAFVVGFKNGERIVLE